MNYREARKILINEISSVPRFTENSFLKHSNEKSVKMPDWISVGILITLEV